ncbi:hypothetical protein Pint_21691 [Pistacia integerrima]|uniref:Uncharacterized protein n=1 Tax=Pistacia integerrima TaxID=434235 RepID=A0ACC0XG95_9ROSI|nr:hypothetical protein Pint_21691 [Pistacia integerrima]
MDSIEVISLIFIKVVKKKILNTMDVCVSDQQKSSCMSCTMRDTPP